MGVIEALSQPRPPKSSGTITALIIVCSCVNAATIGYDGSMMNGLNILPSYSEYFHINTATQSLSTSALYIGSFVAGMTYSPVVDWLGRRAGMFWAAILTIIFVILQTASVNIAMFTVARIMVGYGTAASSIAAPAYVAETLPYKWRGWGLGLITDFYYVGGLVAAGVTYGTANIQNTWAWRAPSICQMAFSILCIVILPFIPESPRWLIYKGRNEEALSVLAQTCAQGDESNPIVLLQYREIDDTIRFEKNVGEKLSYLQLFKTPSARKRIALVISCAMATVIVGNQIASYYFGTMLTNAGITDTTTQLQINIYLNLFCLACALAGTYFAERLGRRIDALVSTVLLTIFLFLIGAFTKIYGDSDNTAGIYGTVACIFLFMGSYSFGWTPLAFLYPPEVLNYSTRAVGLGINTAAMYGFGCLMVFTLPYALAAIGWKTYMINGAWNFVLIIFIYFFWVETRGKTLEEIDELFEGTKHSDVPNIRVVEQGNADLKSLQVEAEET